MPNGFSNPESFCVIGPGVVVNPVTLIDEIQQIQDRGLNIRGRLWVSPRCHIVMPYHRMLEGVYETVKGNSRTGTTQRGIGPVFADKVSYNGIRFFDLADEKVFSCKLKIQLDIKNPILQAFGVQPLAFDQVYQEIYAHYAILKDHIREPYGMIQETLANQGMVLLEGAQGALLDNNWGSYPFCTASITTSGGGCAGLGIAPQWIQKVVGVSKAYTTRVGAGPMPTELVDEIGQKIQQAGQEFGTVTGRARRCGWFDAELVHFTSQLNGCTEIALTKLDVLDDLPEIKICIGYHFASGDQLRHYWELSAEQLERCEPVYIDMPGWQQSTSSVRSFDDLPEAARKYVLRVEELIGIPVRYVSVGPEREATISRN
jgi:adenylosuccinate synthase